MKRSPISTEIRFEDDDTVLLAFDRPVYFSSYMLTTHGNSSKTGKKRHLAIDFSNLPNSISGDIGNSLQNQDLDFVEEKFNE